ncbi:MAG: heavy-metal-associated domain-containing protein [Chthoniobacterales bacterium]|jgi:copper chaperone CopZ
MDPADPHNLHDTADHPILETVQIATEGQDCRECVKQVRDPLMRVNGIADVKVDENVQAVFVTFDARKIQNAEVHEAILRTGYKPAATPAS